MQKMIICIIYKIQYWTKTLI